MRYRIIAAALLSLLVVSACVKKEDFDTSNLRLQGEFDPTYGFPLAYFEAHMDTLVAFIRSMDTSDNIYVDVFANEQSGLLTLYAEYHSTNSLDFRGSKRRQALRKDGSGATTLYSTTVSHSNEVRLGKYLIDNEIDLKNLFVTFDATLSPNITGTTDSLAKYGVEVFLDTIVLTLDLRIPMTDQEMAYCRDNDENYVYDPSNNGSKYTKKIPVVNVGDGSRLSLASLATTTDDAMRTFRILNNEDISNVIYNDAYQMSVSTRLSIVATDADALATIDPSLLTLDGRLFLSSMDIKTRAAIEYSALLYVGDMNEIDTIEADCSGLADYTDYSSYNENGVSLTLCDNDTNSYLLLKAENSMPFNLTLELRGMAEDKRTYVTENLLKGDNLIESPRVEQVPANIAYTNPDDPVGTAYIANRSVGYTNSEIKVPLSSQTLKDLSNAKYLELKMHIESMADGAVVDPSDPRGKPYVILRDSDMLKLRLFVSAGAHLSINRSLTSEK